MKRTLKIMLIVLVAIVVVGFLIPERKAMPVGVPNDYNHNSFWAWPWSRGEAGYPHLGVDIFGKIGTPVVSNTGGIVVYSGYMGDISGNAIVILGPKWRLHYYAHLNSADAKLGSIVLPGKQIGTLGKTGNAAHTQPHTHYQVTTLVPYIWRCFEKQEPTQWNWMKMFALNPADHLPTK